MTAFTLNCTKTTLVDIDSNAIKEKTLAFPFLRISYAPTRQNRSETQTFYVSSKYSQHCDESIGDNEDQMPTFAGSHILLGLGRRVICTWTHVGWDAWAAFA